VSQSPIEEVLLSGNVTVGVVRIGDTVRRPAKPWSKSVDALLGHFREVGFEGAPRAQGYDDTGRQTLSYVEGYIDSDPSDLDLLRVTEVGRLIRHLHDASSTFKPRGELIWNVGRTPKPKPLTLRVVGGAATASSGRTRPEFFDQVRCEFVRDCIPLASH